MKALKSIGETNIVATTKPTDTPSLLARLEGVAAYSLTLADRREIGGSLVELTLRGEIAHLSPKPGNDLMMAVPVDGGDGSFRRRYTIPVSYTHLTLPTILRV